MTAIAIPLAGVANVSSQYYVSKPVGGQLPYLSFQLPTNVFPPVDIAIALPPELYGTRTPITAGPFSFTSSPTSATITLAGQPCWDFSDTSNPIRAAIRTAYESFMLQLEEPGDLPPQWLRQIQDLIASCLPSSFQETLYFRYRYDATNGYIDLVPGMRLRVDFATYQFIYPAPPAGGSPLLDGYVGNGTSYLDLRDALLPGGGSAIVFDPFFGSLARSTVAANSGGAAGLLDFVGGAFLKPYYRLFYPPQLASSDGPGVTGTAGNITIVGADTLAHLKAATDAYLAGQALPVGDTVCASYFRGRATVTPEIGIFLQTRPRYVSLGTTIRQVYASHVPIGRAAGQTFPAWASERAAAAFQYAGTFPNFLGLNPFPQNPAATAPYANGADGLDLPVLAGDAFLLRIANQQ
jgi:hypothetical protein